MLFWGHREIYPLFSHIQTSDFMETILVIKQHHCVSAFLPTLPIITFKLASNSAGFLRMWLEFIKSSWIFISWKECQCRQMTQFDIKIFVITVSCGQSTCWKFPPNTHGWMGKKPNPIGNTLKFTFRLLAHIWFHVCHYNHGFKWNLFSHSKFAKHSNARMLHFHLIIQKQMVRFYDFPWWGTHCVYMT